MATVMMSQTSRDPPLGVGRGLIHMLVTTQDCTLQPKIELEMEEMEEVSEEEWNEWCKKGKFKKEDMDMLVMDFLVNKELPDVAEAFHRESGCEPTIKDLSLLRTQQIVRDLVFKRQYDEAIDVMNEKLGMGFLTERPELHFLLEQQKMVELCRNRKFEAALAFSHKFIKWDGIFKRDCRKTLLLMMYGNDPECPAYELLNFMRSGILGTRVVEAIVISQGRQKGNFIELAMKMVRLEQYLLEQVVKFPHFNLISGYPAPLPHPDAGLQEPF